jgi:hypothetical protein
MVLTDSILNTIKHMLGVEPEYTHFDADIIIDINTSINILQQIGAVKKDFHIQGAQETFGDMMGTDINKAQMVQTYIYLKTKLMFDPPLSGSVSGIIEKQIAELEWRLNVQLDHEEETPND